MGPGYVFLENIFEMLCNGLQTDNKLFMCYKHITQCFHGLITLLDHNSQCKSCASFQLDLF